MILQQPFVINRILFFLFLTYVSPGDIYKQNDILFVENNNLLDSGEDKWRENLY